MVQIPVEDILKKVDNVYEAVIVAAKEARRLNELRLMQQEQYAEEEEPIENEVGVEERMPVIEVVHEEKVTTRALRNLVEGKVQFFYKEGKE